MNRFISVGLLCCVALTSALFIFSRTSIDIGDLPAFSLGALERPKPFSEGTILFVGDVMLGRNVENLIETKGDSYPTVSTTDFLRSYNLTVGNLEGPVPETHIQTKSFGFQFSFASSAIALLDVSGFDILSLANNHAFDHGESGYINTMRECGNFGIACHGHPTHINENSFGIFQVGDTKVGMLFLHTLYGTPDTYTLSLIFDKLADVSDVQVAYVHWGTEYELFHSNEQAEFAHTLIDFGADAVIGHHPHVVQDIELYARKPIFYSLGNFIFDQYFSDAVQQGLGIIFTITENELEFGLVPFSSISTKSQPHLMEDEERMAFFKRFEANSEVDMYKKPYPTITVERD